MIGDSMRTYLQSVAGVTSLLGTGSAIRVHPHIRPQGGPLPAVTYETISEEHEHDLLGASGVVQETVELVCYAATQLVAEQVAEALRVALDGYPSGATQGTWGSVTVDCVLLTGGDDAYDQPDDGSDDGTYQVSREFMVMYRESIPSF